MCEFCDEIVILKNQLNDAKIKNEKLKKILHELKLGCNDPGCRAWDICYDTPCNCKPDIDEHNRLIEEALK